MQCLWILRSVRVSVRDRFYETFAILISLSYIKSVCTSLHTKRHFTFFLSSILGTPVNVSRRYSLHLPGSHCVTAVCPADCVFCEVFQWSNQLLIRIVVACTSVLLVCLLPTTSRWKERMDLSPPPRWPESPLSSFISLEPSHFLMTKKRKGGPQARQYFNVQQ